MLKTALVIKDENFDYSKKTIEISIVSGLAHGSHNDVYQVFDLPNSTDTMGMIGVANNQNFAIKFKSDLNERIGFVVYLDGVNVLQKSGIHSLNKITEDKRAILKHHNGSFIYGIDKNGTDRYLDRYSQVNDTNRLFTFTTEDNKGINEILLSDPTLTNRIEIYVWKEVIVLDYEEYDECIVSDDPYSKENESKIGAGEATHKEFKTTTALENPFYLGKVTFVHVSAAKVSHLGKPLLSKKDLEKLILEDPMNKVPKS